MVTLKDGMIKMLHDQMKEMPAMVLKKVTSTDDSASIETPAMVFPLLYL